MPVDLHIHSIASDGTLTASEIVEKADELGLKAISITDHDSVEGIDEALLRSDNLSLDVVPGVELSSEYNGKDIHILGYFIDHTSALLNGALDELRQARFKRAKEMVVSLASIGLPIDFDDVVECARGGSIGRPHIAQVLVKRGFVKDISEAFEKHIGRGGPAFESKLVLKTREIIELIHRAGGVTSAAHPGTSGLGHDLLVKLKKEGLDALEVWHTDHGKAQTQFYIDQADNLGFLVTGGSDCHGSGKKRGFVLGTVDVPDEIIEPLKNRARQYFC